MCDGWESASDPSNCQASWTGCPQAGGPGAHWRQLWAASLCRARRAVPTGPAPEETGLHWCAFNPGWNSPRGLMDQGWEEEAISGAGLGSRQQGEGAAPTPALPLPPRLHPLGRRAPRWLSLESGASPRPCCLAAAPLWPWGAGAARALSVRPVILSRTQMTVIQRPAKSYLLPKGRGEATGPQKGSAAPSNAEAVPHSGKGSAGGVRSSGSKLDPTQHGHDPRGLSSPDPRDLRVSGSPAPASL